MRTLLSAFFVVILFATNTTKEIIAINAFSSGNSNVVLKNPFICEENIFSNIGADSILSSGTGFAISSNGLIVTNNHVIEGATKIEILGVNQNFNFRYSVEVLLKDENSDLAVLKINDPKFSSFGPIPFSIRQNLAEVGESVFVLGYPLTLTMGTEVKLTNGIISARTGFQGDISSYQISAPVQPGNSGAPLFDNQGNLIGIVNAKNVQAENAAYAVKVNYLKNLIELLNTPVSLPANIVLSKKSLPDKVKTLRNYVFIVSVQIFPEHITASKVKTMSQNYLDQAYDQYQNQNYIDALTLISLAIEADAKNYEAFYLRGLIKFMQNADISLIIEDFNLYLRNNPEQEKMVIAYRTMALGYAKAKAYSKAIEYYIYLIDNHLSDNMDYYNLGKCFYSIKDFSNADKYLGAFNVLEPNHVQGFVWKARTKSNQDIIDDKSLNTTGYAEPPYLQLLRKTQSDSINFINERFEAYDYLAFYHYSQFSHNQNKINEAKLALEYYIRMCIINPLDEKVPIVRPVIELLRNKIRKYR